MDLIWESQITDGIYDTIRTGYGKKLKQVTEIGIRNFPFPHIRNYYLQHSL